MYHKYPDHRSKMIFFTLHVEFYLQITLLIESVSSSTEALRTERRDLKISLNSSRDSILTVTSPNLATLKKDLETAGRYQTVYTGHHRIRWCV